MLAGRKRPVEGPRKPAPEQAAPLTSRVAPPLILVLLALVAYAPALTAGFVWDDDEYVTENQSLRTAEGLWRIWTEPTATPQFYPLTFSTFWVEYQFSDDSPFVYHLTNVLLQ